MIAPTADHDLASCLCTRCLTVRKAVMYREQAKPTITARVPPNVALDIELRVAYQWGYVAGAFSRWLPDMRKLVKVDLALIGKWRALESFERGFGAGLNDPCDQVDAVTKGDFTAKFHAGCGYRPLLAPFVTTRETHS